MYSITLVCTQHKESGFCNSSELCSIVEQTRPEVIFEELSQAHFNESYEHKRLITVETNAVKEYLKTNKVKQVPVDTYPLPTNYYDELDRMYNKLLYSKMPRESSTLRTMIENHATLTYQNGFAFINSHENILYFRELDSIKEQLLNGLKDEDLFRIHSLEKDMIRKREYQIVENIYNFSKDNPYNTAIMFIGAGHAESIVKVIDEFQTKKVIKLNWKNFHGRSIFCS